ncbi:unnamed protein product, partial [marine sediment metagenome]
NVQACRIDFQTFYYNTYLFCFNLLSEDLERKITKFYKS